MIDLTMDEILEDLCCAGPAAGPLARASEPELGAELLRHERDVLRVARDEAVDERAERQHRDALRARARRARP